MALFALLLLFAAPADQPTACSTIELQTLDEAERLILRGDIDTAQKSLGAGGAAAGCALARLARFSQQAWMEARKLAPRGGPAELLGPVNAWLEEVDRLKASGLALEVEYAQAAIRAAIAAAQDERGEMELWLRHARDLSERLATRERRATWPRPFNLLAGELWLEVDRYEEARLAYERAVRAESDGIALVGLARANVRLGHHDEACRAYRGVRDVVPALADEARAFLAGCQ